MIDINIYKDVTRVLWITITKLELWERLQSYRLGTYSKISKLIHFQNNSIVFFLINISCEIDTSSRDL